eukprot:1358193-Rhodomonas_salina.3
MLVSARVVSSALSFADAAAAASCSASCTARLCAPTATTTLHRAGPTQQTRTRDAKNAREDRTDLG